MMNRFKVTGVLVALLVGTFLGGANVFCDEAKLVQTSYYLISIGGIKTPLASLIQTAKENGFTIIVRSGEEVTSYKGSELTQEPEAVLLEADSLLYVDDGFLLLRVNGDDFDYTVRPGDGGYTLIIFPHRDLPQGETIFSLLGTLQKLGVIGADGEVTGLRSFEKDAEKGPEPPAEAAIDSDLYGLTVAADWFSFASSLGLTRVGLRVEVVAEKLPGGAIPEEFQPYIIPGSETAQLAKLLFPIHRLVDLARSSLIGYVRPPYQPQPLSP